MTQELSVEEAHQHRSEIQYAKYKLGGKYSNKDLPQNIEDELVNELEESLNVLKY